MKRVLFASLASTALLALGAAAQAADLRAPVPAPVLVSPDPVSGYGSLYIGSGKWWTDDDGEDYTGAFGLVGGDARINLWLGPAFSLQTDIEAEATSNGFEDCCTAEDHRVQGAIGAHLSWRNPNSGLIGVFGGAVGASVIDDEGSVLQPFVGVEGQWYAGPFTLYGQFGGSWNSDSDSYGMDQIFARGVVRYFFTPNDKLQAEFGWAGGTFSGGGDGDSFTDLNWGALYEHKFNGPVSAFIEYAGFDNKNNDDTYYHSTEHQFMLGARIYFNQGTLLSNDRSGATLDLPKIFRPLAWGYFNE